MFRRWISARIRTKMSYNTDSKQGVVQPRWLKPSANSGKKPVLKIYNSLTRSKEEFIPIKEGFVQWYSCGPTVYDHSHMGHARNYVSTDINRRVMQDYFGYTIKFVQNVTDIDDKIIVAARQEYLFEKHVTKKYSKVDAELLQSSAQNLDRYIESNLTEFDSKNVKDEFVSWSNEIKIGEVSANKPKFPMYLKSALKAYNSIYVESSQNIDTFLDNVKDVFLPVLDKEFGSTVTDPNIFKKLPSYWENRYNEDMARLNVLPPTMTTRVSEYIPEIIEFVDKIIGNGFAYATDDGSVYFDTVKFENSADHDYAKLQPWSKGDMSLINDGEGSLSSNPSGKKNPSDFALWKASKPGEPAWPSKWGEGRPGWHIECSVMASDVTGEVLDIHSGGIDLCFPHHDNEIAQSEAYFDSKQWVNYFMHNGHLHIQGQKMSKSLKNFITIDEALNDFSSRQLRLVFALSAWEKPIDFKDSLIKEVKAYESTLSKFFTNVRALNSDYKHKVQEGQYISKKVGPAEKKLYDDLYASQDSVHAAFCDNLSTYKALKSIQELVAKANNYIQSTSSTEGQFRIEVIVEVTRWIVKIFNILGFETRTDCLGWVDEAAVGDNNRDTEEILTPYVKALSDYRDTIRSLSINKAEYSEFLKASDIIRSKLVTLNVSLDDRSDAPALVKFLNEQEKTVLLEQQLAKDKSLAEKELKKQMQAIENAKREAERMEKMKVNPSNMFKSSDLYSEWDEKGLPTKDIHGEEISKSMKKKLTKQYQAQEKLYAEYLKLNNK